jgi:amino acid transporter
MAHDLQRDLGLYTIVMISMGAMIGSGIFVLPALGFKKAGPAVIFAYILAGLVVLPAALSKAEMATAMPESGGTYLYIDRAMGPLFGTVAGIGAWFSLVFKSSFALVGLGAYLLLFVNIPPGAITFVALGLAAVLVTLNIVGTEQSGQAQAIVVTVVVFALVAYVVNGAFALETARFQPLVTHGSGGVVTAAAFVFVSYAGVTKIASVAEEVENPGRNLPLAMSRDSLLPGRFKRISPRFKTPRNAILLTGGLLLALIAFVPVVELAKLASAFQILVFSILHVALVAFRESDAEFYQPEFTAPGYPAVQVVGVVGGVVLLTQMGLLPVLGAIGMIVGGIGWYLIYGRPRTDRVGAISVLLRGRDDDLEESDIEPDRATR